MTPRTEHLGKSEPTEFSRSKIPLEFVFFRIFRITPHRGIRKFSKKNSKKRDLLALTLFEKFEKIRNREGIFPCDRVYFFQFLVVIWYREIREFSKNKFEKMRIARCHAIRKIRKNIESRGYFPLRSCVFFSIFSCNMIPRNSRIFEFIFRKFSNFSVPYYN